MKIAKCMSIVVAALLVVAFCGAATPKIDTGQSAVGAWIVVSCGSPCGGTSQKDYCYNGATNMRDPCTTSNEFYVCPAGSGGTCSGAGPSYCGGAWYCPQVQQSICG